MTENNSSKEETGFKLPSKEVYTAPSWSGNNDFYSYNFEVIRSGVSLPSISLSEKPFYILGRLETCDIELLHESISRHHAVIQNNNDGEIFIYDLNSTHGTFVNGKKIDPKKYVALKAGDMLVFGASTRKFFLQGGFPEEEENSELVFENKFKETKPQTETKKALSENSSKSGVKYAATKTEKRSVVTKKTKLENENYDYLDEKTTDAEEDPDQPPPEAFEDFTRSREVGDEKDYRVVLDDDDDFFDRLKKNDEDRVETYESLEKKYEALNMKRMELQLQVATQKSQKKKVVEEEDELDSFMNNIQNQLHDEKEKKIEEIEVQMSQIEKMMKLTKRM